LRGISRWQINRIFRNFEIRFLGGVAGSIWDWFFFIVASEC